MAEKKSLIITVKRVFAGRRKWREWCALLRWGLGTRQYESYNTPVDIGDPYGHGSLGQGILSKHGRRGSYELELTFFEPMLGGNTLEHERMREEMVRAIEEVARRFGYQGVSWRKRKRTFFA